ncbi:MAG: hypothetical protein J2P47_03825 [Acetobacteraceae bacterium]|nr:hypothetical protein [Acetobacteraceae bacterium]
MNRCPRARLHGSAMPRLTCLQARIVALVQRNGRCSGEWLFRQVYAGKHYRYRRPHRSVLKVHVWRLRQIGIPVYGDSRTPAVYTWGKEC